MTLHLGDFAEDTLIEAFWSTHNAAGAAATRDTQGTVYVEKHGAATGSITDATSANPVVITDVAHGLLDSDEVFVFGVLGMTEINKRIFTVANKTDDTFELLGEDGSSHTPYTSGGTWTQVNTADVTDSADYKGVTGVHRVQIATADDAYFSKSADYTIHLLTAVIDSQNVDAVLRQFSLENRADSKKLLAELPVGQPPANPTPDQAQMLTYMDTRNEGDESNSLKRIKNDADAVVTQADITDVGGLTTREKLRSG